MNSDTQAVKILAEEMIKSMKSIAGNKNLVRSSGGGKANGGVADTISGSISASQVFGLYGAIANYVINAQSYADSGDESARQMLTTLRGISSAEIQHAKIDTANIRNLYGSYAEFLHLVAEKAEIGGLDVEDIQADIASIGYAGIETASIGYAQIKDLSTDTALIRKGVSGKFYIDNLAVTDANIVSLTAGNIMLKDTNGNFVRLVVDQQGNVSSEVVTFDGDQILIDGTVNGSKLEGASVAGSKLIENSITAREINASSIFAKDGTIMDLVSSNITVANLMAIDGLINSIKTNLISNTTLGDDIDLANNSSITLLDGLLKLMVEDSTDPEDPTSLTLTQNMIGAVSDVIDMKADTINLNTNTSINSIVSGINGNIASVQQTANKVEWLIKGREEGEEEPSSTNFSLTPTAMSAIARDITLAADKIQITTTGQIDPSVVNGINLQSNTSISNIVAGINGDISSAQQTADMIWWLVKEAEEGEEEPSSTNFSLTSTALNAIADKINLQANDTVRISSANQISADAAKNINLSSNGTITSIVSDISTLNSNITSAQSSIQQNSGLISLLVKSDSTSANLKLTDAALSAIADKINLEANNINLSGNETVYISSADQISQTAVNGINLASNNTIRITAANQIQAAAMNGITTTVSDSLDIGGANIIQFDTQHITLSDWYARVPSSSSGTIGDMSVNTTYEAIDVTNNNQNTWIRIANGIETASEETFTVSAHLSSSSGGAANNCFFYYVFNDGSGTQISTASSKDTQKRKSYVDNRTWYIFYDTFTVPENCASMSIYWCTGDNGSVYTNRYLLRRMQIERGNKRTEWKPSDLELDKRMASIEVTADSIDARVESTNAMVDSIANGGSNLIKIGVDGDNTINVPYGSVKRDADEAYYRRSKCYVQLDPPSGGERSYATFRSSIQIRGTVSNPYYYTLSFYIVSNGLDNYTVYRAHLYNNDTGTNVNIYGDTSFVAHGGTPTKIVIHFTSTVQATVDLQILSNADSDMFTTGWIRISDIMLEEGSVATSWKPNPTDIEGRLSSAELKITDSAIKSTVEEQFSDGSGNTLSQRLTSITQTAESIEAEVSSINVGAANLIRLAEDKASISPSSSQGTINRNTPETYYNKSGIRYGLGPFDTDYNRVLFRSNIPISSGTQYTVSFYVHKNSSLSSISPELNCYLSITDSSDNTTNSYFDLYRVDRSPSTATHPITVSSSVTRYAGTLTATVNGTASLSIITRTPWSDSGGYVYINDVKLEIGNKPTDWSAHPQEFKAGSKVEITEDAVNITTPVFTVDITGTDNTSDFKLDEDGCVISNLVIKDYIQSDSMPQLYTGAASITVTTKAGLQQAVNELSGKIVNKNVTITLGNNINNGTETLYLRGCSGYGTITITGGSNKRQYTGRLYISSIENRVSISNLRVYSPHASGESGIHVITQNGVSFVTYTNCTFRTVANDNSDTIMYLNNGAKAFIDACELRYGNILVRGGYCTDITMRNLSGGDTKASSGSNEGYWFYGVGCSARLSGTHPNGRVGQNIPCLFVPEDLDTSSTAPSSDSDVIEETTTTDTLTCTSISGSTSGENFYQGYAGSQNSATLTFSGLSSFSGIQSASLTLRRMTGAGTGGNVSVYVYYNNTYSLIGTIAQGERKSFDVPVAAISGNNIVLRNSDNAYISGKNYSANYAMFNGTGSNAATLEVVHT